MPRKKNGLKGHLEKFRLKLTPPGKTRREAKRDRLTEALAESTEAEAGILFKAASAEFMPQNQAPTG